MRSLRFIEERRKDVGDSSRRTVALTLDMTAAVGLVALAFAIIGCAWVRDVVAVDETSSVRGKATGGLDLGLRICREPLATHGGQIEIQAFRTDRPGAP